MGARARRGVVRVHNSLIRIVPGKSPDFPGRRSWLERMDLPRPWNYMVRIMYITLCRNYESEPKSTRLSMIRLIRPATPPTSSPSLDESDCHYQLEYKYVCLVIMTIIIIYSYDTK